jgi:hypothetical protein
LTVISPVKGASAVQVAWLRSALKVKVSVTALVPPPTVTGCVEPPLGLSIFTQVVEVVVVACFGAIRLLDGTVVASDGVVASSDAFVAASGRVFSGLPFVDSGRPFSGLPFVGSGPVFSGRVFSGLVFVGSGPVFSGLVFSGFVFVGSGGVGGPAWLWLFPWFPFAASATPETIPKRPAIAIVTTDPLLGRTFEIRRTLLRSAFKTFLP